MDIHTESFSLTSAAYILHYTTPLLIFGYSALAWPKFGQIKVN